MGTTRPPYEPTVLGFAFLPLIRHRVAQAGQGILTNMFEHVAAQRIVRVAQPRSFVADRGYPAAAANRGRLFFGYLLLAKQKKVTSCRATPGGFVFGFSI